MTAAEADAQVARVALLALEHRHELAKKYQAYAEDDWPALSAAFCRLDSWLRRRAVGSDKILVRQMERPTGRQVGMSPKKARGLGIPEGGGK